MANNIEKRKEFLTVAELARLLNVSRIAVFKKVKSGQIKGFKIGRNYVIPSEEFLAAVGTFVSQDKKNDIRKIVKKAVDEYGETLKLLGEE
jgi:excisionase family DNA binding protein